MSEGAYGALEAEIEELIHTRSEEYAQNLIENTASVLEPMLSYDVGFRERLMERWGRALQLFSAARELALMAGREINREHRPEAAANEDVVFDVVVRLHARVCLLAYEIETLLKHGLASGALSRWRSMHEVGVVLQFVVQHPTSARLYVEHEHIEAWKAADGYNRVHGGTIKEIPLQDLQKFHDNADQLIGRYGQAFGCDYGWAAIALNRGGATFADIEREVGLEAVRPDYKMASHSVHANPKGIFFDLGTSLGSRSVMLAGPSNAGLADPAYRALQTLGLATATLIRLRPSLQAAIHSQALLLVGETAEREFMLAHE